MVAIPSGRRAGLAVILEPDATPGDPRPLVLTEDKWAGRVSVADFPVPAEALGRMRLPRRVDHRTARTRRDLASALRDTGISAPGRRRDRRSTAARDFLVQLGVPESRLRTVSYGKERPQCTDSTEACWQMNRRVHFSAGQ